MKRNILPTCPVGSSRGSGDDPQQYRNTIKRVQRLLLWCVVALVVTSVAGCQPPPNSMEVGAHRAVMAAIGQLSKNPKQAFSTEQLAAMVGWPEKIMTVGEFGSLLTGVDPGKAPYFRRRVEEALARPEDWHECVVWVYSWTTPLEFHYAVVGEPLGVRYITARWSIPYYVHGSKVLFSQEVRRIAGTSMTAPSVVANQPLVGNCSGEKAAR